MKKPLRLKKAAALLIAVVLLMTVFSSFAFAGIAEDGNASADCICGDNIWVSMRILGYDDGSGGVILNDCLVRLNDDTGYTVLDALEKVCADRDISYTVTQTQYGPYISEIGGQQEKHFQPDNLYYSGWAYRLWKAEDQPANPGGDTMPWDSVDTCVLHNGDKVTWYYTLPAESWYTIMDNYSSINYIYWEGQTINVSVKGQKYEDTVSWNLLPFTSLEGATVTLNRACDGMELAAAVSDSSGNAALQVPYVRMPTLAFVSVKSKYFTSGPTAGGLENVGSWRKPVIIF